MKLVLFDLDNTLLAGDSDYAWGQFLIDRGIVERANYEQKNEYFYQQYRQGTLDIEEFLAFQLQTLARYDIKQLDTWHAEFMQQYILPMITDEARAAVDAALSSTEYVAIITATNRFVTAPIAAAFGVKHLIATEPEQINNRYTGKVQGTPCFQQGKVTRLHEWLSRLNTQLDQFDESWFYSDSRNDLPLLQQVTHPVAVNPDPTLQQHANQHQWPVLHWLATTAHHDS